MDFETAKLKEIFGKCKWTKEGKDMIPDLTDCQKYVNDRIFTIKNGSFAVYEKGILKMYNDEQAHKNYINRFPAPVKKWFLHEDVPLYDIDVIPESIKVIDGNIINMCAPIIAKYKKYDSFSNKTKELCQRMLDHIRLVWCNEKNDQYEYDLIIIKRMCQGIKNDACIYLRGPQGLGKSTPVEFICEHVIGKNGYCKESDFNMAWLGKRLIAFEEIPLFSKDQWVGVSSKLKDGITGKITTYDEKKCKII